MKISKKLLVEGNDDKHVISAICNQHAIPQTFEIVDCKGIDSLIVQIPIRFKESGIDTVGIIIDADTDLNARWQSIREILRKSNFVAPDDLPETGLILNNETQKVGIWIMPNNNTNGMLEDFISFLIPDDDKLLPIAQSTLETIESKQLNQYSSIHKSKALIHSWLAWQENPGTPMGLSITKRYLTTHKAACQNLVNWLTILFEE